MSDEKGLILPGLVKPPVEAPEEPKKEEEVKPQEVLDEKREELKKLLAAAHDSTEGVPLTEISLKHPYWNLMNQARQFQLKNRL